MLLICELRISTNCQFPLRRGRGDPSENDHEFPFAGDIELLGLSLNYVKHLHILKKKKQLFVS